MISEKLKLDDIDRKIISLVQEEPNLTHTQIAERIDRSQPTVGMRIRKLEKSGVLQFQPGINFKKVDLFLITVRLDTKKPHEVMDMAKYCPFMLNAFRISGDHNVCVLLASSKIQKLENVVNYHFRGKMEISKVSMEVITEMANDFIMPIDFHSEDYEPTLENGCGDKCQYRLAKKQSLI